MLLLLRVASSFEDVFRMTWRVLLVEESDQVVFFNRLVIYLFGCGLTVSSCCKRGVENFCWKVGTDTFLARLGFYLVGPSVFATGTSVA
ncbi:hypothetical protein WN943_008219 [Citrus x changshan-huyou]